MGEWISVDDSLPKIGQNCWRTALPVLVNCEMGVIPAYAISYTNSGGIRRVGFSASLKYGNNEGDMPEFDFAAEVMRHVTHWQPLPEPPQ